MANTMRFTEWFSPTNPCKRFETNELLFKALQNLDSAAILCVQVKVMPTVRKFVLQYGLPIEKSDDVLNESTVIFLRKIESGAYQFQGHNPSTYLIEIVKRVALMATRTVKRRIESLENHTELYDTDWEAEKQKQESAEMVKYLLNQIGQPCQQVIQLHHIDGYSDEEVIKQGMTRYSTIDSLKMKRSDCMKKLIQIAQQWKTTNIT
jgi:DNA-directed RNA polymerase specialized sigma24 family protein